MTSSPPAAPGDPHLGTLIAGKYRLQAAIAQGGGGRVYKGVQEPLGRYVAVKILDPMRSGSPQSSNHTKRFLREATVSSRLSHPNTVVVHDYGTLPDDGLFLVMEYLDGPTLRQVLASAGALPVARAVHIARQIAGSLVEAHAANVVHRDLKPPNVLLVARGDDPDFVKVVDFGLVKSVFAEEDDLTMEGAFVGSPVYMSPEQATGEHVDQRSDIYSFGTMLYEMLCGRPPFRKKGEKADTRRLVMAHVMEEPTHMDVALPGLMVPPKLDALVMRCLAKRSADRPQTMREVLSVLEELETAPAPAPVSTNGDVSAAPRRARLGLFVAAGAALALGAVIGINAWLASPAPEPEVEPAAAAPTAPSEAKAPREAPMPAPAGKPSSVRLAPAPTPTVERREAEGQEARAEAASLELTFVPAERPKVPHVIIKKPPELDIKLVR